MIKELEFLKNKDGFLGIDNKTKFNEKVVVVPFGLEKTVVMVVEQKMDQKKL